MLPDVLGALQGELDTLGLGDVAPHLRMTGCPNGCARPYTAELGIVGRTKRGYDVYVGGNVAGTRLAELLERDVPIDQLATWLRPVLERFRDDAAPGEGFGDWCARRGIDELRALLPPVEPRRGRRAPPPSSTPSR